jgi:hypothetical protein
MSSSKIRGTRATALSSVKALISGTEQHFPSGPIHFGNATYTATTLSQRLQKLADAMTGLLAAQNAARDAMAAMRAADAEEGPLVQAYRRFLHATFATAAQTLADFGLEPMRVAAPPTTETRVAAVEKARATRKARGTKGRKQRLAIKGNVTGVTVVPVTGPAESEPAAAK